MIYYFTITLQSDPGDGAPVIIAAIAISLTIFSREFFGVRASFINCLIHLVEKVNNPETKMPDISSVEIVVLNIWVFEVISLSSSYLQDHLANKGKISVEFQIHLDWNSMLSIKSLLGRPLRSNAVVVPPPPPPVVAEGDGTDTERAVINKRASFDEGIAMTEFSSTYIREAPVMNPMAPVERTPSPPPMQPQSAPQPVDRVMENALPPATTSALISSHVEEGHAAPAHPLDMSPQHPVEAIAQPARELSPPLEPSPLLELSAPLVPSRQLELSPPPSEPPSRPSSVSSSPATALSLDPTDDSPSH